MSEDYYGPVLPPPDTLTDDTEIKSDEKKDKKRSHDTTDSSSDDDYKKSKKSKKSKHKHKKSKHKKSKHKKKKKHKKYSSSSESDSEDDETPVKQTEPSMIGPTKPTIGERLQLMSGIGPQMPGSMEGFGNPHQQSDDEDIIGPMPSMHGPSSSSIAEDFERRSQKMKEKLENPDGPQVTERDTWMTELPPELTGSVGLTNRTFRKSSGPKNNDRSVWTDTPAEREKREKDAKEGKTSKIDNTPVVSARDQQLRSQVEEYNKSKRGKSLMEMHEEKVKKKKKKDKDKPKERKPFSREEDLQVNKFDEAKRKMYIKRAQGLTGKFSHGSQQFI